MPFAASCRERFAGYQPAIARKMIALPKSRHVYVYVSAAASSSGNPSAMPQALTRQMSTVIKRCEDVPRLQIT